MSQLFKKFELFSTYVNSDFEFSSKITVLGETNYSISFSPKTFQGNKDKYFLPINLSYLEVQSFKDISFELGEKKVSSMLFVFEERINTHLDNKSKKIRKLENSLLN